MFVKEEDPISGPVPGVPWAFIAVMGVTGAGKSSFIKDISNDGSVQVGHGLESCTSELRASSFHYQGYNINLVDTPGFNDTHRSETEILKDIADWLRDSYSEAKVKLSGVIYLHPIKNTRMEGSALRNLKMFRELCGDEPLKNVTLVTTFWSDVRLEDGEAREEELRTRPDFWGGMLKRGSKMARYAGRKSGLEILQKMLGNQPTTLKIQKELVDEEKPLLETAAGTAVNEELLRMEKKYQEEQESIRQEMKEALQEKDELLQEILEQQQQKLELQMDRVHRQQEKLRADRRAEMRAMELNFEKQLSITDRQRQKDREEFEERLRLQELSFEEIVAAIRVNESKLNQDEREKLETEISKASEKVGKDGKLKKTSKYLIRALEAVFPFATMLLLGIPVPVPFSSFLSGSSEP